ncbi:hypothetical protein IP84_08820 [beta proteobacterium AAP99]|nr:hypothetical protein IP84_08820 [beta proteobacterium AAP99]
MAVAPSGTADDGRRVSRASINIAALRMELFGVVELLFADQVHDAREVVRDARDEAALVAAIAQLAQMLELQGNPDAAARLLSRFDHVLDLATQA